MSKDPAFLFYPNDYIGGTMGMTFEEKGAYMELLMTQFNRGHMTTHMIAQVVGQNWDKLKDKFIKDENGLWYNERLEEEKLKRQKYTKSRRNNVSGNNQHTKNKDKNDIKKEEIINGHMTSHMENENENVNEDIIKNKIVLKKFTFSDFNGLPSAYMQSVKLQLNNLKQLKLSEDVIISYWEAFKLQHLNGTKEYKTQDEVYNHFINWIKKQNFNNGTNKSNNKSIGSVADKNFEELRNWADQFSDEHPNSNAK